MPKTAEKSQSRRRTQAERRATTRAALLDATIESLVEDGYANTTTTKIVERAGVSRGAQVHHFPTKAELVAEAIRHLLKQLHDELQPEMRLFAPTSESAIGSALDLLWNVYNGPLYAASVELFVAARTDPDLRKHVQDVESDIDREISAGIGEALSGHPQEKAIRECIEVALATLRGLALLEFADGGSGRKRWPRARRRLTKMYLAALEE
jgi:AcrR family transcriptional regulator